MNAKQAEEATGISRRNLRFYEQQGLVSPARNPDNDYRDYSPEDIETLKKIRLLRMLDVSLEDIGALLKGEVTLTRVMALQEQKLRRRQQELQTALDFCRELQGKQPDLDALLERMDHPRTRASLFEGWIQDYRAVAGAEEEKRFYFSAGNPVEDPRAFTEALLTYGEQVGKTLVITKEGMQPEFTLDGVGYSAERIQCWQAPEPSGLIVCQAVEPETLDAPVQERRGRFMRFLHRWWWVLPLILVEIFYQLRTGMLGWILAAVIGVEVLWLFVLNGLLNGHRKQNKPGKR